ncbi:hypothetical protein ACO0K9_19500 [Undibacterium sp. Ji50W]|uniref:hypothetical protein n=1 Tax=Undibacterium sp. Ji50W TaxID=3413041 RepID=UPI003BF00102
MDREVVSEIKPTIKTVNMDTAGRYFISVCLTVTIFGLGYFCGTRAEKETRFDTRFNNRFNIGAPAPSTTANTSRASVPAQSLRQQVMPRKAGPLV